MSAVTLTGAALRQEATRLAIPGRSKMSADELRTAIGRMLTPVTPVTPVTPFRATGGKRKIRRTAWSRRK